MKAEDPVSRGAARAIAHLNDDHADALLAMAQALGGKPEATSARCLDADRTGLDLAVATPAGKVAVRIPYLEPIESPEGLRKATVGLARHARAKLRDNNP